MAAREPIMRKTAHGRLSTYERTSAMLDVDKTLCSKCGYGLADRTSGSTVGSHQLPLRWELSTGRQLALHDGSPKVVSDLEIRWPVTSWVDSSLHEVALTGLDDHIPVKGTLRDG
jgi:hypothetical protein